jgi:hypothetical protein
VDTTNLDEGLVADVGAGELALSGKAGARSARQRKRKHIKERRIPMLSKNIRCDSSGDTKLMSANLT